jgi:alpha-galactosidase
MSARFGMDLDVKKLSREDKAICIDSISAYKEIRDVTAFGDLYRVENPHENYRGAINFVSPDKSRAVVFVFQLKDGLPLPVHPQGLDPAKGYIIHELNHAPGRAAIPQEGMTFAGEELMSEGVTPPCAHAVEARIIELSGRNGL